jgi:hypothetical protein
VIKQHSDNRAAHGSPLFDDEGNIIGIVVASLDAAKAEQSRE